MTHRPLPARRAGRGARDSAPARWRSPSARRLAASHRSTTTYLAQAHYFRGDYERVVELATENLAALPADWTYESLRDAAPPIRLRSLLAGHEPRRARPIRRGGARTRPRPSGSPSRRSMRTPSVWPIYGRGLLHLLKGDWAAGARTRSSAGSRSSGRELRPHALPARSPRRPWALAQLGEASEALSRLREGEQLLERRGASGIVGHRGWAYHALGRACLLLGRLDEARRLAERAVDSSPASARVRRPCAAPARRHRDPSRPVRCRERPGPLPPGAGARRAARHAPARRPLPPRPRQALPAHGQARAGPRAPHHRDDDVPRDGHAVLAGAGGGGAEALRGRSGALLNLRRSPARRPCDTRRSSPST